MKWMEEGLPPKAERRKKWVERLLPVKQRPMMWALVKTTKDLNSARSAVHQLRHGVYIVPPGKWEFEFRGADIYARYLGSEEAE